MDWLQKTQKEHNLWAKRNFGTDRQSWQPLLGVMEEVGELAHAHLKRAQGIRTAENHRASQIDAIGDIVIYLLDYCNLEDIDLSETIDVTWNAVRRRDWKKNPNTAHKEKPDG